jgi:hypothetical protein
VRALTKAGARALERLGKHGGRGTLDRYGNAWAGEQKLGFAALTWLRLFCQGWLEADPEQPDGFKLKDVGRVRP